MRNRTPLLLRVFAGAAIVIVTAMFVAMIYQGVYDNEGKPLTTLDPQGVNAATIQNLVKPVFIIGIIIGIAVMVAVAYIAWRFRQKPDEDDLTAEIPSQLHGNTTLEIGWTLAPALILLFVAVFTVATIRDLSSAAPNALPVKVEGQQWWWAFTYDTNDNGLFGVRDGDTEDFSTANELVIPVGREVTLYETSNDVIHSFWIPALNGKRDAVPGITTEWKLQADEPGTYMGQCTEFCGLSHGNMRMVVRAVPADEFDRWYEGQRRPALRPAAGSEAAAGEEVFNQQLCSSCHLVRGVNDAKVADPEKGVSSLLVSGVAPDLTHYASRGTFSGSIFNSHYPNPDGNMAPFGQTCQVPQIPDGGSGIGPDGQPVDRATLPVCPPANSKNSADIPYASDQPGNPDNPVNEVALEDWLRDPPAMKPMVGEPQENAGGKYRGMPNLDLSEQQIDLLVAYLNSLK